MASVAVAGSLLPACSSPTPAPFRSEPPPRGDVIAARVIAEDRTFDPRFRGGAASRHFYPGVIVPTPADASVDYSQEFVVYLAGASFDQATLDGTTVHVRVSRQARDFQMVKLDGQQVLSIATPSFSFEDESGAVICTSGWGGCG